jgi:hypothetical protein
MKQMYFRTDYKDTLLPSGVLLMKGHWYDVLDDYDEGYLICNIPECTKKRFRPSEMTVILKENLEDDVYVVTGKSEEFKEGGGAI